MTDLDKKIEKHEVTEALNQLHDYFLGKVETKQGKEKVNSVFTYLKGLLSL